MLINIIFGFFTIYLGFSAFYLLFFSLGSLGKKSNKEISTLYSNQPKIAVFIPAYKEDAIIVQTALKATHQNYPKERYDIIVIADQLQQKTLDDLEKTSATVVKLNVSKSSKTIALNYAMQEVGDDYDVVVVLDADNIMEDNFLAKIATAYLKGSKAIQGHRIAKNKQNNMAFLDAISEEINNNIFRQGHVNFGFSSALIGSAMAFDYRLFKKEMAEITALGGFDKELEVRLLRKGVFIDYLKDAIVYDEKVANLEVFKNQRTRWIAAQIRYGLKYTPDAVLNLLGRGNVDLFDKIVQFWLMPRLMMLGITFFTVAISIFFTAKLFSVLLGLIFSTQLLAMFLAIPRPFYSKKFLKSLMTIPGAFLTMIIASFGYKKAQKNFLHTPKSQTI